MSLIKNNINEALRGNKKTAATILKMDAPPADAELLR